jgi:hypothetical protein
VTLGELHAERVGVETKLLAFIAPFCKKTRTRYHRVATNGDCAVMFACKQRFLGAVLFMLCHTFWFRDVILKFCFTLVELEKTSPRRIVFEAKLPLLLLLFLCNTIIFAKI